MELFRQKGLPGCYNKIPFIRKGEGSFIDCHQDLPRIEFFLDCARGNKCISELDSSEILMIKAVFPAEVIACRGMTNEPVEWDLYFFKPHDLRHVDESDDRLPYESVSLADAGINQFYLDTLAPPDCACA